MDENKKVYKVVEEFEISGINQVVGTELHFTDAEAAEYGSKIELVAPASAGATPNASTGGNTVAGSEEKKDEEAK